MKQITPKQAQLIIDVACPTWKQTLAENWSTQMVLRENITINDMFYKQMREACTPKQNILFDEIFGKDTLDYNIGDYLYCLEDVIMNGVGKTEFTQGDVYVSTINNCLTNNSGNIYHTIPRKSEWTTRYFRMATKKEIEQSKWPKQGIPHLVSDDKLTWVLAYSDGKGKFKSHIGSNSYRWNYSILLTQENLPKYEK